jgi:hypothetical protein
MQTALVWVRFNFDLEDANSIVGGKSGWAVRMFNITRTPCRGNNGNRNKDDSAHNYIKLCHMHGVASATS